MKNIIKITIDKINKYLRELGRYLWRFKEWVFGEVTSLDKKIFRKNKMLTKFIKNLNKRIIKISNDFTYEKFFLVFKSKLAKLYKSLRSSRTRRVFVRKAFVFFLIFNLVSSWFYGLIPGSDWFAPKKAEAVSAWSIRQEINILDGYLGAAANNVATSSEIIRFDPTVYSGTKTYYLEIVASTSASFSNTVTLRRSGNGTDDCTVTIPTNTTTYTLIRSSSCTLTSTAQDYVLRISSNAGGTTGVRSARLIVLQSFAGTANSAATSTQTQIEIGNKETGKTNTATSSLTYPKYWTYDSSKWDGTLTFSAEVTYKSGTYTQQTSSSTDYLTAGTYTYNVTSGATQVVVEAWGGGGAGGGGGGSNKYGGGGGAGGQYAKKTITSPTGSHTLVVGGPVSGLASSNGGTGNSSTYDTTTVVAKGGAGGQSYTSGKAGGTGSTTGCVGDICYAGGSGATGATTYGGGGGGGAGSTGTGNSGSTSTGGTAKTVGGGAGGNGSTANSGGGSLGNQAGGGGGGATKTGTPGSGAAGRITLTETIQNTYNATTTLALQEDDGAFGSWTDKVYIVTGGTASSATRVRSSSFTPTNGRHYRIVGRTGYSGSTYDVYDVKIVVDQVASATGSLIDSYPDSNTDSYYGVSDSSYAAVGQSFTSAGGTLGSAVFSLKITLGSPTGNIYAKLYAINNTIGGEDDIPSGSALAVSDPVDVSTLSINPQLTTFTFSGANQYSLVNGTSYVIVVEYTAGAGAAYVGVGYDSSSSTYTGNQSRLLSGSWTATTGMDTTFSLYTVGSDEFSRLEPQYLLANTKLDSGTSAQKFLTKWDTSEWSGVTNTYLYAVDAANNSTSVVVLNNVSGGSTVTGSTVTSPSNHATSTSMTMPSTGNLDVAASTNNNDIYGTRILAQVAITPPVTTTLSDGTDPGDSTIAPGSSVTDIDQFNFQTSSGTDNITALTVQILPALATTTISQVQVTNTSNTDVCTAINITDTSSNTLTFTCSSLTASTLAGGVPYKIRITPKTHANMPAVPGASYAVTATTTGWTGTNTTHAGSDTNSATITIDNLSPGVVTGATASAGDSQVSLSWTNPADSDLSRVMVLASTSAITFTPVEGTTYSTTTLAGASRVACYGLQTSCTDTSLTNGTAYYYKIYTLDSNGNWSSTGVTPTGSPATPSAPVTLSGVVYQSETGSVLGNKSIKVYKNGTTLIGSATSDANNGAWSATLTSNPASGDVVTVYIDNDAINANTIFVSDGLDKSNINLYGGVLFIRHDSGSYLTNLNLHTGAIYGETDIMYSTSTANGNDITLESGADLLVASNDYYVPGGSITTQGGGDFRVGTTTQASLNITGGDNISGDFIAYDGSTITIVGNMTVGGSIKTQGTSNTGNFAPSDFTMPVVTMTGTGTISDGNPTSTFYDLVISGTANITNASAIAVKHNLTVSSGGWLEFSSGTVSMDNGSSISNSGTLVFNSLVIPSGATVTTSSSFSIGGTLTVGSGATFSPTSGTITTQGAPASISNSGTLSFNNLEIGTGTSLSTASDFTVKGVFTAQDLSTFNATAGVVTMGTASSIVNNSSDVNVSFKGLTVPNSADVSTASSFYVGSLVVGTGSMFLASAGTITIVNSISNSGTLTFNNLNTDGAVTTSSSFSVSGNLTFGADGITTSGGTITIGGDIAMNGYLDGTGSVTVNGGDMSGFGFVNLTGGTFTLDGTGLFGGSDNNWVFNELKFGNGVGMSTTTTSTGTGSITSATTTVSANQILDAGVSKTWNLTSSFEPLQLQGTLLASSSTFVYQGTNNATVTPATYYNLEISPASGNPTYLIGTTTGQTVTVNNNLTLGGAGNVTLDANNYDPIINVGGTMTIGSGDTLQASNSSLLTISGDFTNNGTFTHNNGTVKFTPGTSSTISSASNMSFYNLEFISAGKTLKFQNHVANTPKFTIDGAFTATGVDSNSPVYIESTSYGDQWLVYFSTEQSSVTNTSLRDSGCFAGSASVTNSNNYDRGNNGSCWGFAVVTPAHYRGGGASIELGSGGGATITGGTFGTPASVADAYSENNGNTYYDIGSAENIGASQSFTALGGILDSVKFYLAKIGNPAGSVSAKIYNVTGTFGQDNVPTGSALATADSIAASSLSTSPQLATFNFSGANRINLSANSKYAVSVEYSAAVASDTVYAYYDSTSPTHPGNLAFNSGKGGWVTQSFSDLVFYLYQVVSSDSTEAGSGGGTTVTGGTSGGGGTVSP